MYMLMYTICLHMNEVVSVRVKRELKRRLEASGVDLGDAIRKYLEELACKTQIKESLRRLEQLTAEMPPLPAGSAAEIVRKDRDGH